MIGKQLAHYEILAKIGQGGMGEVYRARDTKLGREVALKLLPEDFARDPERLARFRREAKVLASLNHPHIAGIHGLEEDGGRHFLAMELAEGEDLSARLDKGALSVDDAVSVARQIAAGLEEAHEKGVVHRDLKPANVMVSDDGEVKILDFGLARAYAGESAVEGDPAQSPTITAAMTGHGVILGTAAYMSPEQARGRSVDRRADIWAFGVILFEMLAGRRLFHGETISDTLAAVLREPPSFDELPAETPAGVRNLLQRCLERDPLRRLRDIGEARVLLEAGGDASLLSGFAPAPEAQAAPTKTSPLPWAVALVLLLVGLGVGWKVLPHGGEEPLLHLMIPPPEKAVFQLMSTQPGPAALSPDGEMVAFAGRDEEGVVRLYLRRLSEPASVVLSGTEGCAYPFWSPEGNYIGFFAEQKLKKVAVAGGPPVTLCPADNGKGGTWNRDGVILFAPSHNTTIHRVSATGGEPVSITSLDSLAQENSHRHPRFLPDGEHFLFLGRTSGSEHRICYGSLGGEPPRELTTSETAAEYSAGHLLTVRERVLMATPFDPDTGELGADSVPLAEGILMISSGAAVAVCSTGGEARLVYQISQGRPLRRLQWLDRKDSPQTAPGEPGNLLRPRLSPDGSQAMVEVIDPDTGDHDLYLVDMETGLRTRFTFEPGQETRARWDPTGRWVVYTHIDEAGYSIVRQEIEGTAQPQVLLESEQLLQTSQVSPDGRWVVFEQEHGADDFDIMRLSVEDGEVAPLLSGPKNQAGGRISPNGRWLAFHDDTTGTWQTYVVPLQGGGRRWQVTTGGAVYPRWSADGRALRYVDFPGVVHEVKVDGTGDTFRLGGDTPLMRAGSPNGDGLHYSFAPDGSAVLYAGDETAEDETGLLHLVTDWRRGLVR